MSDLTIWNMHGPTVYGGTLDDLPSLIEHQERLNDSNAGKYRLILTSGDRTFELVAVRKVIRLENA